MTVNVDCCKDCDEDVDDIDDDLGDIDEPLDNCTSATNTLENGKSYTFMQYGVNSRGRIKDYWMASSAVNEEDSDYDDTFHGTVASFPGTTDEFSQGAFVIRRIDGDQTAIN